MMLGGDGHWRTYGFTNEKISSHNEINKAQVHEIIGDCGGSIRKMQE